MSVSMSTGQSVTTAITLDSSGKLLCFFIHSTYISITAYDEDQNQKACLLAALQSERSMLDDEIKLKRETINKLAETTGNISK